MVTPVRNRELAAPFACLPARLGSYRSLLASCSEASSTLDARGGGVTHESNGREINTAFFFPWSNSQAGWLDEDECLISELSLRASILRRGWFTHRIKDLPDQ